MTHTHPSHLPLWLIKTFSLLLLFSNFVLFSQEYQKEIFIQGKDSLPYRILLPHHFNPQKTYPLILFLHGAGERGDDNEAQLIHGSDLFLNPDFRKQYPAIVVFPQCPKDSYWAQIDYDETAALKKRFVYSKKLRDNPQLEMVEGLLSLLEEQFSIDASRRYVGGLSMGGMGTFELVARNPDYFAAAIAICGGGNRAWAKKLKNTPFWIFHGTVDEVVHKRYSKIMHRALKKKKAKTLLTLYPDVNHNSWDYAFQEEELFPWLFSQQRKCCHQPLILNNAFRIDFSPYF